MYRFWILLILFAAMLVACDRIIKSDPPPAPAPRFTGPDFLHGTVGSVTTVRGYQPQFVSGYSIVTQLDGTGSADCPPNLRKWLVDEAVRRGFGRVGTEFENLRPSHLIASETTAVVMVYGIIPPGSAAGTSFDLVVEALPNTQTTSLEGGVLYSAELSPRGVDLQHAPLAPPAEGRGPIFLNPFALTEDDAEEEGYSRTDDPRIGRVLGGGVLRRDMGLQLTINNPSHLLAARIANRLNGPGMLQQMPNDPKPFAEARTADLIDINILARYRGDTAHMLEVARHAFLNPTQQYARAKARELLSVLEQPNQHVHAERIAFAWEAMGKQNIPFLRTLYDHPDPVVRITALGAGANLSDARAGPALMAIAEGRATGRPDQATRLLGRMVRVDRRNFRAAENLRKLIDSEDQLVRLAALDELTHQGSKAIERRVVSHKQLQIDLVNSSQPMIFVTRQGRPRVVIFGENLRLEQTPMFFSTWGNRLMMRRERPEDALEVFCRPMRGTGGIRNQIDPTVIELVSLLAARPGADNATRGFDLDYARIVRTLQQLTQDGWIDAPFVLQSSDLMQRVAQMQQAEQAAVSRPESDVEPSQELADPPDSEDNWIR